MIQFLGPRISIRISSVWPLDMVAKGPRDFTLTFRDITWVTGDGRGILHGVSGVVQAGHVTAIMGESGSGKTTLLQILAGQRLPSGGEVRVNGKRMDASAKRYIGMVPQVH